MVLKLAKRPNQSFKRNLFSILLIVVIGAALYPYLQQPQEETVNILKRYGVYDKEYNYVMFGTLDVDNVLNQANRSASTLTYGYSVQNYTGVYSYTYTNYHTNTTGEFTYGSWSATSYGFYSSNYYSYQPEYTFVNVTYSLQGSSEGGVDFSYQNGPTCNWDQTTNGRFAWSGCTSFVLLVFTNRHPLNYSAELQNRTFTSSLAESYGAIVVGNYGSFFYASFRWRGIDWRFYLFYATLSS